MLYFFYFAFLLIKNSQVFETGLVGLAETAIFFFFFMPYKSSAHNLYLHRHNSRSEYHGIIYLIQPKLVRSYEFSLRIFSKIFNYITFCYFSSHLAIFNEIFGKKKYIYI